MEMIEVRALVRKAILESNPKLAKATMMEVYDAIIDMYDHSTIVSCGIKVPVSLYDGIKPYFMNDQKIGAIKYLKDAGRVVGLDLGLKEAKDVVEEYYEKNKHLKQPYL